MTAPDPAGGRKPAEFDAYAAGYDAGMDNPVKAALGGSAEDYVAVKLNWLRREVPALDGTAQPIALLDYGCGTATLLRLIARAGCNATLSGCDLAAGMIEEAARTWPSGLPLPALAVQQGPQAPFPDGSFDLVVISAVLHHVPPAERDAVHADLFRLLRPGGQALVFEHNPLNPLTRWVVARTPIDRNAILLRHGEAASRLREAGFADPRTRFLMFAPPRLRLGAVLDRALGRVPLGAQYAVLARRPA